MNPPKDIDSYIADFPEDAQKAMQEVRATIKALVPDAVETISYAMPAFMLHKTYLVYFAGYKKHIGLYPAPIGVAEFEADMAQYKTGKGSVQFPLDKPMPLELISRIVKFRVQDSAARAERKKAKKG